MEFIFDNSEQRSIHLWFCNNVIINQKCFQMIGTQNLKRRWCSSLHIDSIEWHLKNVNTPYFKTVQQINYWCSKTDGKGRYAGIRSWTLYSNCCCFATNLWNRNILSVIKAYFKCGKYLTDIINKTYNNIYKCFVQRLIFSN